jgi:DNA-binding response OmpR family regulator
MLVIEDEPSFAGILFDLAHEMQYRCLVAHGADEGLRWRPDLPDAILLDMRLPDRPGLRCCSAEGKPADPPHPVHIVSGNDQCRPCTGRHRLRHKRHARAAEGSVPPLETKLTQKIKRILLVEDDDRQRESVVHLISDDDVEITAVALGEQALELLQDAHSTA